MRKRVFSFAILVILSIINSSAFGQPPQISTGLAWLNSVQTATGNWPGVETDEYSSTVAALDAAYAIEPASTTYTTALEWLSGQVVSPTDYLSRRIIALKRAGLHATSELEGLQLYRNPDGGWGGVVSYVSNNFDTALALQALKAANYPDTAALYKAINFLTSRQNPDGGWGFVPGKGSTAYETVTVLRALTAYNSLFLLQDSISKGSAYLLTKQNIDGGFGSSPSTIYETALSIISLIESGHSNVQPLQNGINYLTTTQLPNGSWNDDPYSTALALQALAAARPNLTVSSITLSKSMPQEGEETTITATVTNAGYEDAAGVVVRFFFGDPVSGGVQIGSDQILQIVARGSSAEASVTAGFKGMRCT